jgi:hypothetical protein
MHEKCSRFKVTTVLGFHEIPSDLFPGDNLRAEILIQQMKKVNFSTERFILNQNYHHTSTGRVIYYNLLNWQDKGRP